MKGSLKEIGLLIYLAGLLLHCEWGKEAQPFWVALYFTIQNAAMCFVCSVDCNHHNLFKKTINRLGCVYFSSAAIFYTYALITRQNIYFSNSGFAGYVLSALLFIALILTLIDAYATRK